MYYQRSYVLDGGLISYAPDPADNWHRAAVYVAKILGGREAGRSAGPAANPIRPDREPKETAKTLGITIPPSILAQAGELIE
jgi:putative ABC transport system substrate-binding protein